MDVNHIIIKDLLKVLEEIINFIESKEMIDD